MPKPTDRWCLYRWYDRDGWLLYIGITDNLPRRIKQHRVRSWWARWGAVVDEDPDVRGVDARSATDAEVAAIRSEHPVFNLMGAAGTRERVVSYLVSSGIDATLYMDKLAALLDAREPVGEVMPAARRAEPVTMDEMISGPTVRRVPAEVEGWRLDGPLVIDTSNPGWQCVHGEGTGYPVWARERRGELQFMALSGISMLPCRWPPRGNGWELGWYVGEGGGDG